MSLSILKLVTFEAPFISKDISQELFISTSWNAVYAVMHGMYALR